LEWVGKDGKESAITLGTIERFAGSTTAENLGVNLQESKQMRGSKWVAVGFAHYLTFGGKPKKH
jgi:hypothetical protein